MIPRILTLSGTPHPKAEVTGINPGTGILTYRWLDAAGQPVDSGGSVTRFSPQIGQVDPTTKAVTFDPVPDATLAGAIESPPAEDPAPVVLTPLTILGRLTQAEEAALATSTDLAVAIVRNRLIAASEVRSDDPRTAEGRAILIAKGIITEQRAAEIFA